MMLTFLTNPIISFLSTTNLSIYYPFITQLRPILSSCPCFTPDLLPPLTTLIQYLGTANFLAWLSQLNPTGSQIVISFLPEITLAVMITYLLGVVAIELAQNRAPKVLAIEC